jgi:glycosyltransferase involved in cell wall biosynthesis
LISAEIVIPCYNEAESLQRLFDECVHVVETSKNSIGFIIVNNGSIDDTNLVIQRLCSINPLVRFIELSPNRGYGGGILAGLRESTAPTIGWTHADLQTPLTDCLIGLELIRKGNQFVKGTRKGRHWLDQVFSRAMGIFVSLLFMNNLAEVNAQPTLVKREIYQNWSNEPSDFSLDLYALVMAVRSGAKIERFDVDFLPRLHGTSKWNLGYASKIRFIKRTIIYSFKLKRDLK